MTNRKRWAGATATFAALVAGLFAAGPLAGSTALAAVDDPPTIPDSVLLQPEDLGGVRPTAGGPDQAVHPLPPKPCADTPAAEPLAARTVRATVDGHLVYEYVARHRDGEAAQVAEDLRAEVRRCPNGPGDVRHRIAGTNLWGAHGTLLWRDWDNTDRMDTYLIGVAGDYLIVVLDTGDGIRTGDLTATSTIGGAAIRRAGGDTTPVPSTPSPSTPSPSAPESSAPALPADHCDMAWFRASVLDIPQHSAWNLRGCDGEWAVLDINTTAGACGPLDPGPRPGCTAPPRWQRHFMRFEDGWLTFSGSRVAGCAGVHAVEPTFPTALCENLPAR